MSTRFTTAPDDATKMLPESEFLGAWDMEGDITLVIRDVQFAHLERNVVVNKAQQKACLFFQTSKGVPCTKGLLCGSTNLKVVISLYGKRWKGWVGKPITMYATECQSQGGKMVACVRIRPTAPPRAKAADVEPGQPMDQNMRRDQIDGARDPGED